MIHPILDGQARVNIDIQAAYSVGSDEQESDSS